MSLIISPNLAQRRGLVQEEDRRSVSEGCGVPCSAPPASSALAGDRAQVGATLHPTPVCSWGLIASLVARSRSLPWGLTCQPGAVPGPQGRGLGRRRCRHSARVGTYGHAGTGGSCQAGQEAGHRYPSSSSPLRPIAGVSKCSGCF